MKVTLYTTSDCMFSKQEKDYLASKGVTFDEKNVQTNRDFLQEMLNVSNNFAGTPVTKIEQDNGQSVILKGFTQSEFDNVFASNIQAVNSTVPAPTDSPVPPAQPAQDQPVTPPISTPEPVVETPEPAPAPEPPVETPVDTPVETPPMPTNPDPLPPMPTPEPVVDNNVTEMHSTIPTDQPAQDQQTPTPNVPTEPEPVVETPEPAPTPEPVTPTEPASTPEPTPLPTDQPTTGNDQQLESILDSLKTKAEEPATPPTSMPDFPSQTS